MSLENVVAAETSLSMVDGAAGALWLRGVPVEDLAGRSYEQVLSHLGGPLRPSLANPDRLRAVLGEARVWSAEVLGPVLHRDAPPGDFVRAALAALPAGGECPLVRAVGAMAVIVAAAARRQAGFAPVQPEAGLGQVEDFLRMSWNRAPSPLEVDALTRYLTTVSDHGLNASTFTARVVASTGAAPQGAVTAAYCALEGPLHGGAPGPVLDMLDAVGTPARARAWLIAELAAQRRIMGFGHRVYRTRDPRADVLKNVVARLQSPRLALATAVEEEARALLREKSPGRALDTNVEFYTALLLDGLGFDRSLFTPLFALGRVLGWVCHVAEQQDTGRLIRPVAKYVGPSPQG